MPLRSLVTGGTRGIGRAICDDLAEAGHEVIAIARSAPADFPYPVFLADLANERSTAAALEAILADGPVDNLINNAGHSSIVSLADLDWADVHKTFEINMRATLQCAQACIPGMVEKGRGRVVNLASRALLGRPRVAAYAAAKAGVVGMTTSLALEFATNGVTVNCVAPGATNTEMFNRNNPPGGERYQRVMLAIPMAVAYFLSDAAAYVTGQVLYVCGGWSFATI
jgi:3-oxoacyl-[acyl-carrier protein] reductase